MDIGVPRLLGEEGTPRPPCFLSPLPLLRKQVPAYRMSLPAQGSESTSGQRACPLPRACAGPQMPPPAGCRAGAGRRWALGTAPGMIQACQAQPGPSAPLPLTTKPPRACLVPSGLSGGLTSSCRGQWSKNAGFMRQTGRCTGAAPGDEEGATGPVGGPVGSCGLAGQGTLLWKAQRGQGAGGAGAGPGQPPPALDPARHMATSSHPSTR